MSRYSPRIEAAADFALKHCVLLLRSASGVGIDVALGCLPFEAEVIRRSRPIAFPADFSLRLCSPEALIVLKAFASRPRDWLDVEGVIVRQTGKLDWIYIRRQLGPLAALKEAPAILAALEKRRVEFER